jgi:SWI/SNF related-matrix-associated actin-dependent regulator of chromatin subfamily C
MLGRKRNGAPDAKYYDTNETIAKFDSVRQWLLKNCKKVCGLQYRFVH